jgi:hypothetical protein
MLEDHPCEGGDGGMMEEPEVSTSLEIKGHKGFNEVCRSLFHAFSSRKLISSVLMVQVFQQLIFSADSLSDKKSFVDSGSETSRFSSALNQVNPTARCRYRIVIRL